MRKLKSPDVFSAFRLIKEAGMRNEVQRIALMVQQNKKVKIEELGVDFLLGCLEGLAEKKAEQKFYEFLSGPAEMSIEEIKDLSALELIELLKKFKDVEDVEGWRSFFKSLGSLMR